MEYYLWYHGTTKEAYESIMRNGFTPGTYFTPYFNSAISMGGPYVFAILRQEDPTKNYWEWISSAPILPAEIHSVVKVDLELLYYNKSIQTKLQHPSGVYCKLCEGHGELAYPDDGHHLLPRGCSWQSINREIIVCPDCHGYGNYETYLAAHSK